MNSESEVVPMLQEEATVVADLMRRVIEPLRYYNERARAEELAKYTEDELRMLTADDPLSVLVAREQTEVKGFCVSRYDDGLIWLSWFGTHPNARRRGVGQALLEGLGQSLPARRAHKIWCDTRTDNVQSQAVLVRSGFHKLVELRNHWYGQDFYLWEWYPG